MDKMPEQVLIEKENIEIALRNLKEALARKERTVIELAATSTFLHNIYSGIENIMKQILKMNSVEIPRSNTWHKDLIVLSESRGIISKDLTDKLYEYLTFRYFFIHAYGFMLEEAQLKDLASNIPEVWRQFLLEVESYLKRIT